MSSPYKERQNKATQDFLKAIFGDDSDMNSLMDSNAKAKALKSDRKAILRACPSEKAEHLKLVSWLRIKRLKFNHTANERKTTARQGAELKRLGVSKGFPDISIYLGDKVLFVELKRAVKSKSKVSKEQSSWIEFFNTLPYAKAKICYGADEAIEFVKENI